MRNVNLVDDFLFSDGRRRITRNAVGFSRVTRAIERQATRRIRQRINRIIPLIAADIAQAVGRKTGNAANVIRFNGRNRITGTTFNSLRIQIIGPDYIRALDEGGTIRPTRSQFLAIPVLFGLRADGTPKLPGPRAWGNIVKTFVYRSKGRSGPAGRRFIAYKQGDELRILYVLVESVEITGRNFIDRAYGLRRAAIERIVLQEMSDAFFGYVDAPRRHLLPLARIRTRGRR